MLSLKKRSILFSAVVICVLSILASMILLLIIAYIIEKGYLPYNRMYIYIILSECISVSIVLGTVCCEKNGKFLKTALLGAGMYSGILFALQLFKTMSLFSMCYCVLIILIPLPVSAITAFVRIRQNATAKIHKHR